MTYLLSIFLLKESISIVKILSLALSFGGVVMITLGDRDSSKGMLMLSLSTTGIVNSLVRVYADSDLKDSWKGDVIMAGGACFWALYLGLITMSLSLLY